LPSHAFNISDYIEWEVNLREKKMLDGEKQAGAFWAGAFSRTKTTATARA